VRDSDGDELLCLRIERTFREHGLAESVERVCRCRRQSLPLSPELAGCFGIELLLR
jgi:hypothetical protein